MSVDGQKDVTTGLPQISPILPVLFAIHIAEIHRTIEEQVQNCQGISLVGDVTCHGSRRATILARSPMNQSNV